MSLWVEKLRKVRLPFSKDALRKLRAGDWIRLDGEVYTARDQAHKKIMELLEKGKPLPFKLEGSTIYYSGPTPALEGMIVGSAGPTTSSRMDRYASLLYSKGVVATIGKGERSEAVREACKRYGALYLASIGGLGAYLGQCVESSELIAYPELLAEAIYRFKLKNFPVVVIFDSEGRDYYREVRKQFKRR